MQQHILSHMDHGFTAEQWSYIFAKYAYKAAFFVDTFELPENLGTVTDELYGPSAGDAPVSEADVYYARRGDRAWNSRLVRWPKKSTRFVRVIAGPHEEKCIGCAGKGVYDKACGSCSPCRFYGTGTLCNNRLPADCEMCGSTGVIKHTCILYTAYGVAKLDMPAAPKEPGDIRKQMEALEEKRREYFRAFQRGEATPEQKVTEAAAHAQIIALREKRAESDVFWRVHGLAHEAV